MINVIKHSAYSFIWGTVDFIEIVFQILFSFQLAFVVALAWPWWFLYHYGADHGIVGVENLYVLLAAYAIEVLIIIWAVKINNRWKKWTRR